MAEKPGNPMSPPDGALAYEQKRYANLDQRVVNDLEHRTLGRLVGEAGLGNGAVLNVPCGFGRFTELIGGFGGSVYYLDLHPQMLKRSRERHGTEVTGYVNGSMRSLPFRDGTFEIVVTVRFFHHFFEAEDRNGMLRELSRVSARYVLITYYRPNWFHTLTKRFNPKGNRIVMLGRGDFRAELVAAGLEPVHETAPLPFVHAQRFVLCKKVG